MIIIKLYTRAVLQQDNICLITDLFCALPLHDLIIIVPAQTIRGCRLPFNLVLHGGGPSEFKISSEGISEGID